MRGDVILALSFDREYKRSSRRNPSSNSTRKAQERRYRRSPSHVPDKDVDERERGFPRILKMKSLVVYVLWT